MYGIQGRGNNSKIKIKEARVMYLVHDISFHHAQFICEIFNQMNQYIGSYSSETKNVYGILCKGNNSKIKESRNTALVHGTQSHHTESTCEVSSQLNQKYQCYDLV